MALQLGLTAEVEAREHVIALDELADLLGP
jgi:hypothetical protein